VNQAPAVSVSAESLHDEALNHLGVAVAIYRAVDDGADFRLEYMNELGASLSRAQRADVQGRLLSEAFPGAEAMGFLDALRRVHASGESESLPALHYADEHTAGWYENAISRLPSGLIVALYRDVTDELATRAKLAASDERYALLTESMSDGIFDWNLEDNALYLSPRWKQQVGFRDDELSNEFATWQRLLHPDHVETVNHNLQQFLAGDARVWDQEFPLRQRDGSYRWIHAHATAVRDEGGKALRLLGVHIDIDEQKRTRERVERHRQIIDALFESLPDLFLLVDEQERIVGFHAGRDAALPGESPDFVGRTLDEIMPAAASARIREARSEALRSDALTTCEYSLPMLGGTRHYEGRLRVVPGRRQVSVIIRDITERLEVENSLRERVEEITALNEIHLAAQRHGELHDLMGVVAAQAALTPTTLHAVVTIDGEQAEAGDPGPATRYLMAPVFDGERQRGSVRLASASEHGTRATKQQFVNAIAQMLGLWLRSDSARQRLSVYQRVVSSTQDKVALVNRDLRYVMANAPYAESAGFSPGEVIDRSVAEVLGEQTFRERLRPLLERSLAGEAVNFQEWRDTPDGPRYHNVLYAPYHDGAQITGVVVSAHDITALQTAQAQLKRAAQVFSHSAEGILMTAPDGAITDVNEAFADITGYEPAEVIGRNPSLLASGRHDAAFFARMFATIDRDGSWHGEVWNRRRDGELFPCLMTVSRVESGDGQLDGYVGVFADITAMKENQQRLELLAHHDALTGLPNRAHLMDMLERSVKQAQRRNEPFTVMFIDLDHFKDVNDTLGHAAGDQLLRDAAERLQELMRSNDLLARVGGDEFVALFPQLAAGGNASVIARKVIDALAEPFDIAGSRVRVSASVGIASYPADGDDGDTLLRHADTAMYQAKVGGRADWRCYSEEMTARSTRHLFLLNALRSALEEHQLRLVYQPQYDLSSGDLCGLEALMRWQHPDEGEIDTTEFIGVASEAGFIRHLDSWALNEACGQLAAWQHSGLADLHVAVNISARSLGAADFAAEVRRCLERHGIAPERLELEISEAELFDDLADDSRALDDIAALGVGITIDDFGTGYSKLLFLRKLPIRRLKIDGSFVRKLPGDEDGKIITDAIVAMGTHLRMQIVAESVETQAQADYLQPLHVQAQGYLFSAPLEADAVPGLVNRH
jgi:diguanylate cyclase (GGDEF)-like protein/PAS domain S-box-containing protein